ncbi:NPCBM/NEW2 domain-containing protein [Nonomuraea sp. NPDC050536]|uniref:NPCBM/NEW2 domain-containing protein n=1 Tax=Nonomuraea sp. NPDC050536 TaxID=3364366 RepID=UPI0037C55AC8
MTSADQGSLDNDKDRRSARGNALIAAGAPIAAAVVTLVGTLVSLHFSPSGVASLVAPNAAVTATVVQTVLRTVTAQPIVTTEPPASPGPTPATGGAMAYLADMQDAITDSHGTAGPGGFKINGTSYLHSIGVEVWQPSYTAWSEYTLDGSYRRFEATLGLRDELATDSSVEFVVYGNGKALYRKTVKYTQQVKMAVDITGLVKLRLSATRVNGDNRANDRGAVFGDAVLTNEPPS